MRYKLVTSSPIYQVTKINSLGFGDVTYLREGGTITYFVLKIGDSLDNEYTFLWGEPENFNEKKVDPIVDRLNECIDILQGTI